jgi:hypothetical protein
MQGSCAVVADGPEEGATQVSSMTQRFQIIQDETARGGMEWYIARFSSLAGNLEMGNAAPLMLEVLCWQTIRSRAEHPPGDESRRCSKAGWKEVPKREDMNRSCALSIINNVFYQ